MKKFIPCVTLTLLVVCWGAKDSSSSELGSAAVKDLAGDALYRKSGTARWAPLDRSTVLSEGDSVKTGADAQLTLELSGAGKIGEVTLRRDGEFTLKTLTHDPATGTRDTLLDVHVGSVIVQAEKLQGESKFRVKTPTSIVGVRGTKFEVSVRKK